MLKKEHEPVLILRRFF